MKQAVILITAIISMSVYQYSFAEIRQVTNERGRVSVGINNYNVKVSEIHYFFKGAYEFNDYLAATFEYEYGDYDYMGIAVASVGAQLGKRFYDRVTPYISAGYGYFYGFAYHYNYSYGDSTPYYGGGIRLDITKSFYIESEYREYSDFEINSTSLAVGWRL